jgi:type IV pilus biogenesis protein CpaD/CtpE
MSIFGTATFQKVSKTKKDLSRIQNGAQLQKKNINSQLCSLKRFFAPVNNIPTACGTFSETYSICREEKQQRNLGCTTLQ